MSVLEFQNVSYSPSSKPILNNITIEIDKNDFVSIMGPSGSGKSTFLKLCCHLISPTQGSILFKSKPLDQYDPTELRKSISYCFQTPWLFGTTVMDNLAFPFSIRKLDVDYERIHSLLSSLNLETTLLNQDINKLSGGEKQRIGLIRSVLFKPEVLLLDEVTSALDSENTKVVENMIVSLHGEGIPILWITHDAQQSRKHANKILRLNNGSIELLEVVK